jgi:hypothetical protein
MTSKEKATVRENARILVNNVLEAQVEFDADVVSVEQMTVSESDLRNARKTLEKFINNLIERMN